jgi:hypothetical protein
VAVIEDVTHPSLRIYTTSDVSVAARLRSHKQPIKNLYGSGRVLQDEGGQ